LQKIARKIMGARFLIIDELSLIGEISLLEIHEIIKQALTYWFNDNNSNSTQQKNWTNPKQIYNNINTLPFGGLHVLFAGIKIL